MMILGLSSKKECVVKETGWLEVVTEVLIQGRKQDRLYNPMSGSSSNMQLPCPSLTYLCSGKTTFHPRGL